MNQGKYIFAQLTDFLPRRVFDRLVEKYSGNKKIRTFTCWNQMLCMIFGQLTARDSMRELMLSLEHTRASTITGIRLQQVAVPIWGKQTGIEIIVSTKNLLIP